MSADKKRQNEPPARRETAIVDDSSELVAAVISGPVRGGAESRVASRTTEARRIDGVVLGWLVRLGDGGIPLVDHPENPASEPVPAVSTSVLDADDVGRRVALAFERGDPGKPIVLGPIHGSGTFQAAQPAKETTPGEVRASLDGETLTLTADKQIVLRCGDASITLTRSGKVLIRGAYLLNRSSGVNRIKGGSVQIN